MQVTNSIQSDLAVKLASIDDKNIISNLYCCYLHDLSEFTDSIETDENGRFIWDSADLYWENSSLHPFLIWYQNKPIGFILLTEKPYVLEGCDFCVQEFFILKKYRRQGLGRKLLKDIFQTYKGVYCLLILEKNKIALNFWRQFHQENNQKYEEGLMDYDNDKCYYHVFLI
jgi:predicted acetyltransferase